MNSPLSLLLSAAKKAPEPAPEAWEETIFAAQPSPKIMMVAKAEPSQMAPDAIRFSPPWRAAPESPSGTGFG